MQRQSYSFCCIPTSGDVHLPVLVTTKEPNVRQICNVKIINRVTALNKKNFATNQPEQKSYGAGR
jgi:hypothetical protein